MLGLPSTTEVTRRNRLPKEAFYGHLKVDAHTRDEFVGGIESIMFANSVKPATANVADGERVHEIQVLQVELRQSELPRLALEKINESNRNPKVLVCIYGESETTVIFREGMQSREGELPMSLTFGTLDEVWDAYASQVVFGGPTDGDLDARIRYTRQLEAMKSEIERLDGKCRKEKQINKRNALFDQMRTKKNELKRLENEEPWRG